MQLEVAVEPAVEHGIQVAAMLPGGSIPLLCIGSQDSALLDSALHCAVLCCVVLDCMS